MTSSFKKIIALSKKISKDLLKDKTPESLENSDLFSQSDKEYILDELTSEERIKERLSLASNIDKKADWKSLKTKIDVPVRKIYLKYVAVAAVLILVAITIFLNINKSKRLLEPIITNTNIVPGTDKAILTLNEGAQIVLEKGKSLQTQNANSNGNGIIYKANQSNTKELIYNFLTIPRGGAIFYQII